MGVSSTGLAMNTCQDIEGDPQLVGFKLRQSPSQVEYGVPIEITLAGHVVISTQLTLNLRQAFYRPGSEVTMDWGEVTSNKPSRGHIAFAVNVPNASHTNTLDSASSGSIYAIGEAA